MSENWSRLEVEAAVEVYFEMLMKELRSEPFNKTALRRALSRRLDAFPVADGESHMLDPLGEMVPPGLAQPLPLEPDHQLFSGPAERRVPRLAFEVVDEGSAWPSRISRKTGPTGSSR